MQEIVAMTGQVSHSGPSAGLSQHSLHSDKPSGVDTQEEQ